MKVLSQREKIFLIVCAIVVVSFGVIKLVIKPFYEAKEDVENRETKAQTKLAQSKRIMRDIAVLDKEYAALKEVLGVADARGKEVALMMSRMESAGSLSNLHIINMQPLRVTDKEMYNIFSVEVTFDGSWKAISAFLYALQDKSNLFRIDELNLERFSDATGALRGRAVLSRIRLVE